MGKRLRGDAGEPSRNDVLEEVHYRCWAFTRGYLSKVYGELVPLLADRLPHPVPHAQAPRSL